jgi:adenylylsulfate kinase
MSNNNITEQDYIICKSKRNQKNKHKSFVIWFTGLSGSGKSTIANKVEEALFESGIQTYTLDGDNIRMGINKGLGFNEDDRHENLRRIAEIAKLFVDAGVVTIAAFVSPLEKDRELVKNIIGSDYFVEVFVHTSLEECEKRDVKGLYKRARTGEIKNFTGISAKYEKPVNPNVLIETETESIEKSIDKVVTFVKNILEI